MPPSTSPLAVSEHFEVYPLLASLADSRKKYLVRKREREREREKKELEKRGRKSTEREDVPSWSWKVKKRSQFSPEPSSLYSQVSPVDY